MTYRSNSHTRCVVCSNDSYGICPRCARPLCLDHLPVRDDARCVDCELAYDRTRLRIGRRFTVAFFAGFCLALIFLPITGAVLAAMLTSMPFALLGLRARKRFLAEGLGARASALLVREIGIAPARAGDSPGLGVGASRTDRSNAAAAYKSMYWP